MRVLFWYCDRFGRNPAVKTLDDAPDAGPSAHDKAVVAFIHVEPKDIDISMANGMLIIKGEKKFEDEKKKENYHRIERSYGSFYRSLPLSAGIKEEAIKAQYDKGILTITLPKSEVSKAKKIEITS